MNQIDLNLIHELFSKKQKPIVKSAESEKKWIFISPLVAIVSLYLLNHNNSHGEEIMRNLRAHARVLCSNRGSDLDVFKFVTTRTEFAE